MRDLTQYDREFRVVAVERIEDHSFGLGRYEKAYRRKVRLESFDGTDNMDLSIGSDYFKLFSYDTVVHVSFTPEHVYPVRIPDMPPLGSLVDESNVSSR